MFAIKRQISPTMSLVYRLSHKSSISYQSHKKPLIIEVENQNYHYDKPLQWKSKPRIQRKNTFLNH
jgi:hypothetical protein